MATASTSESLTTGASVEAPAVRLLSLDVYRGLIMAALAASAFGLDVTAQRMIERQPDSGFWKVVLYQSTHTAWAGCSCWDLVQPSFLFMVGVAAAYSYAKRHSLGDSWGKMFGHALWRSMVLVLLGVLITSNGQATTVWAPRDILAHIGLAYPFLFLLWRRPLGVQMGIAAGLMAAIWLLYESWPGSGLDVGQGNPSIGITAEWATRYLAGIRGAWHNGANAGYAIESGLFGPAKPFPSINEGYVVLGVVLKLVTMLSGLSCGELLRSSRSSKGKLGLLFAAGLACIVAGWLLDITGACPMVKRLWTPAWTLFSTGWCFLILAALYAVVDVWRCRCWTSPLIVFGANSIAAYLLHILLTPWMVQTLQTHFGACVREVFGFQWAPVIFATMTGSLYWIFCRWMYRHGIFIRV